MNLVTLLFAIELGIMPINNWVDNTSINQIIAEPSYYATMDSEVVLWDHLFIGGWIETMMVSNDKEINFDPLQQTYQFRAGFRYENIELGFEHVCGPHPVRTYPQFSDDKPTAPFEGGYEKMYIKVSN